jgi:hypothetical protein
MSQAERPRPTGKERMKRRPTSARPIRFEFDIKKAYSPDQLREVGAIALIWNQIEASIHWILFVAAEPKNTLSVKLAGQTRSVKYDIDLLRSYFNENDILSQQAKDTIKQTFDAVLEYSTYRNAIVHSFAFDHAKGIAQFIDPSREVWQILVTIEALTAFYDRLVILKNELREVDMFSRIAQGPRRITVLNDQTHLLEPDQPKALREKAVPEQTAKLLLHQKERLSLPPLPKFPDELEELPGEPVSHD